MIPRRFINLMIKDLRVGGSYWLSRLRPEENLFYTSAVEAVASETQAKRESRKPFWDSASELPSPKFRFKSSHSIDSRLSFMPFYGDCRGPSSEGRIVVSDSAGHTHLYDAEEVSGEMLPATSKLRSPISVCIAGDGIRTDELYTISGSTSDDFKCLSYCNGDIRAWKWLQLPEPPYIVPGGQEDLTIMSYALLGDNKTICFSGIPGTYCFDTASLEWTKAGSWGLPFLGRALRVPQLHGLYFGFLERDPEKLIALELPSPLHGDEAPAVLHQWRGFGQPKPKGDWTLMDSNLLYVGSRRFCVFKWFAIFDGPVESDGKLADMAAVLTGVEILNGYANKSKLQMIKHKTKTYIFDNCSIEAMI